MYQEHSKFVMNWLLLIDFNIRGSYEPTLESLHSLQYRFEQILFELNLHLSLIRCP